MARTLSKSKRIIGGGNPATYSNIMKSILKESNGSYSSLRLNVIMLVFVAVLFAFLHPLVYQGYLSILTLALGAKQLQKGIENKNIITPDNKGMFHDQNGTISIIRVLSTVVIIASSIFSLVYPLYYIGYTGMMSIAMGGKVLQKFTENKK